MSHENSLKNSPKNEKKIEVQGMDRKSYPIIPRPNCVTPVGSYLPFLIIPSSQSPTGYDFIPNLLSIFTPPEARE